MASILDLFQWQIMGGGVFGGRPPPVENRGDVPPRGKTGGRPPLWKTEETSHPLEHRRNVPPRDGNLWE